MKSLFFVLFFMLLSIPSSHAVNGEISSEAREVLDAIVGEGQEFARKFDFAPNGKDVELTTKYLDSPIPENLYTLAYKYRNNLNKSISSRILEGLRALETINGILGQTPSLRGRLPSNEGIAGLKQHVLALREFQSLVKGRSAFKNWPYLEFLGNSLISKDHPNYQAEDQILISVIFGIYAGAHGEISLERDYYVQAVQRINQFQAQFSILPVSLSPSSQETRDEFLLYISRLRTDIPFRTNEFQNMPSEPTAPPAFHRSNSLPSFHVDANPGISLPLAPPSFYRSISVPPASMHFNPTDDQPSAASSLPGFEPLDFGLPASFAQNRAVNAPLRPMSLPPGLPIDPTVLANAGMAHLLPLKMKTEAFEITDPSALQAEADFYFDSTNPNGLSKPLNQSNVEDLVLLNRIMKITSGEAHPQIRPDNQRLTNLFVRRSDLLERGILMGFLSVSADLNPVTFAIDDLWRAHVIALNYQFYPQLAGVQLRLAKHFAKMENLGLAESAYQYLISLNPMLLSLSEYDSDAEPNYFMSRAYRGLANVYIQQKRDQDAVNSLLKAIDSVVNDRPELMNGFSLRSNNLDRDQFFLKGLRIELADLYLRLAREAEANFHFPEAASFYMWASEQARFYSDDAQFLGLLDQNFERCSHAEQLDFQLGS